MKKKEAILKNQIKNLDDEINIVKVTHENVNAHVDDVKKVTTEISFESEKDWKKVKVEEICPSHHHHQVHCPQIVHNHHQKKNIYLTLNLGFFPTIKARKESWRKRASVIVSNYMCFYLVMIRA